MRTYRVNAIVLRRMDFGETDRILTLYSRERGKIRAIAKGAKKAISRLAGATELFTAARYLLAAGQKLEIVTQTEIRESFPSIRRDMVRIAYGIYFIELVDRFVEEGDASQDLFDLLLSSLYMLDSGVEPVRVARAFELQMMDLLGYVPQVSVCSRCENKPVVDELAYSPSIGGLVCSSCGPLPGDCISIKPETVLWIENLLKADASTVRAAELPSDVLLEISKVMRWHIRYRLERDLKTTDFLEMLAQMVPDEKL